MERHVRTPCGRRSRAAFRSGLSRRLTRCCSTGQSSTLFMLILKTFLPGDGGAGGAGGGLAHTGTETTP
eukprot:COSAG06_NODE_42308_length_383_cov_0.549296_1_plen_68_part_01